MGWSKKSSYTYDEVKPTVDLLNETCAHIPEYVRKFQICGSFRREKGIFGDVEFLILKSDPSINSYLIQNEIIKLATKVLVRGNINMSVIINDIQVDTKIISNEYSWPFALIHFTGSVIMNVILRKEAKRRGYRLNEYGLFVGDSDNRVTSYGNNNFLTEKDIFDFLNIKYHEPKERNF